MGGIVVMRAESFLAILVNGLLFTVTRMNRRHLFCWLIFKN